MSPPRFAAQVARDWAAAQPTIPGPWTIARRFLGTRFTSKVEADPNGEPRLGIIFGDGSVLWYDGQVTLTLPRPMPRQLFGRSIVAREFGRPADIELAPR